MSALLQKATHIFSAKYFQHICISLDVNFNESLAYDIVSFEQLGPDFSTFFKPLCRQKTWLPGDGGAGLIFPVYRYRKL